MVVPLVLLALLSRLLDLEIFVEVLLGGFLLTAVSVGLANFAVHFQEILSFLLHITGREIAVAVVSF